MGGERYRVLILGHGEMGQAMEYWLRPRHALTIWQRHPAHGAPLDLASAAAGVDIVLFCVPTIAHVELAARLKPGLRREALCLSIAKGLDDAGRTAAQVFHEVFGEEFPYGVLYGPMISEEIRAGRPAFAEFASRPPGAFGRAHSLFAGVPLALHSSSDVFGASWCAVLKNAYAILFGVADGLGLGDNMRGYLAVGAVREIEAIVTTVGGSAVTPWSLAGLGDLITTATSPGSHHHALGHKLARGEPVAVEGEGVHSLKTIHTRRPFQLEPYPLLRLAHDILVAPVRAGELMQAHLDRLYRHRE
jgi:glycerol-3-phosphate dehydrogenase (NAD(P)+)